MDSGKTKKQLLGVYTRAKAELSSLSVLVPALAMVQRRGRSLEASTNTREKKMGRRRRQQQQGVVTVRSSLLSGWKQTPSPSRKREREIEREGGERDKKAEAHWLPTKTLHQTLATHGHASAARSRPPARPLCSRVGWEISSPIHIKSLSLSPPLF